jgi:hypothetical protein
MPGPWRSTLTDYQSEIAELRNTVPPTPYEQIARILKERHNLDITAGAIWSFVRARDPRHQRKVFKLPDPDHKKPMDSPTHSGQHSEPAPSEPKSPDQIRQRLNSIKKEIQAEEATKKTTIIF